MSHPDPLFDPENAYEDDDMMIEDENYDDYNDFYGSDDESMYDDLDGDHESGLASAGFGTDEDYGHYGDDIDAFHNYYGEDY